MSPERTNELIINELIVAIGYALDTANPIKTIEQRLDCMKKCEKILDSIQDMRTHMQKSDVKPVRINTNDNL